MVKIWPRDDLSKEEISLGEKGRIKDAIRERERPPPRKIKLKEAVYKFSSNYYYRSVKKRTSSGSWKVTGDDMVIHADRFSEEKGFLRTRKYYEGDARILTPWIMYEFHMLDADQEDFDRRAYVLCIVTHTGEQGDILIGGNNSTPPKPGHANPINEHEKPSPCEVLEPNTVINDNNNPNAQGLPITEEAIDTNLKKPHYTYLMNMIVCIILLPALIGSIRSSVSLEYSKITNTSGLTESCRCFNNVQTSSKLSSSTFLVRHFTTFPSSLVSYLMRVTVSPAKVHQVFFNFRGVEMRYNFVSHVGDAFLQRHAIKFFMDKNEQRGKDLNNLFVRIEESSIALAIFSTRYPESRWCIDELVKVHKLAALGKLRVIPIFYNVEARDVRKPTGDSEFGKNFWKLAEDSTGDQIKKWKEALEGVTNKMGVSINDKSVESDSIKDIVVEVQRVIKLL